MPGLYQAFGLGLCGRFRHGSAALCGWWAVAKAESYIRSSDFRGKRRGISSFAVTVSDASRRCERSETLGRIRPLGIEVTVENERIVQPRVAGPSRQSLRTTPEIQPSDQSSELLQITAYARGGVAVVVLVGELDVATAPKLARYFETGAGRRRSRAVVDVSNLTFCDCSGLTALLRAARHCVEAGGWLRLSGASAMLTKTLRVTHLGRALACYPDVDSAFADSVGQTCDARTGRPGRSSRTRTRSLEPAAQRELSVPAQGTRARVGAVTSPVRSSGN